MPRTLLLHKIILMGSLGFIVSCLGFFYFIENYQQVMAGFIVAAFLYYVFYERFDLARIILISLITLLSIYLAFTKSVESFTKYSLVKRNVSIIRFSDIKLDVVKTKWLGFEYEYIVWLDEYKIYALFRSQEMVAGKIISGKLLPLGREAGFDYFYIQNVYFRVISPIFKNDEAVKHKSNFRYTSLRSNLLRIIDLYLSYPQNEFLKSILFNERDNFPKYLRTIFKETNTYHIFAISGQHITIFTIIFVYLLISVGLKRKYSVVFSSIFVFIYVLIVGAPVPAIRALLFNFLAVAGFFSSRKIDFKKLLFYVAATFLFFQPHLIKYDLSFVFSFGASLGLIVFSEPLSYFIYRQDIGFKTRFIFDPLISTIAASILIAPLNLFFWHNFNLFGIFINILVLMFIPLILFLGIMVIWIWWWHGLMLVWGFVLEKLVFVVGWLTQMLNQIEILKFKFTPSFWHLAIYYLIVAFLLYSWAIYKKKYVLPASVLKSKIRK